MHYVIKNFLCVQYCCCRFKIVAWIKNIKIHKTDDDGCLNRVSVNNVCKSVFHTI